MTLSETPRARAALPLCAVSLALLGLAGTGRAQTSAADPKSPDEIVSLSEFTVTADTQNGYVASESLTGSRIATKIKDLPFNIDVITSQFLDDFAVLDNSQIFQGGVITDDWDAGGGYTVRGISNTGELYNGFWLPAGTPVPNALKDRIEVLNGPSAGAYGQTAPGGIINIVSKQPSRHRRSSLRFTAGNYDTHAARVQTTGPLGEKTAYLALLDYSERAFQQPWHEDRSRTAAFSLSHEFDPSSNLRLDLVASSQRNHSPSNRVPYLYDSKAQKVYGIAYNLMNRSMTGPNSYKNTDNFSVFGSYDKKLNDIFSVRLGSDYYAVHNRSFNTTDITAYDPNPAHASSDPYNSSFYGVSRVRSVSSSYSAPSYKKDYQDGGGFQADLLAHYFLFNHQMENRTLATIDFQSMYEYVLKKGMPASVKTDSKTGKPKLNSDGSLQTSNAADPTVFPRTPLSATDTSYWIPLFDPLAPSVYPDPSTGFPTDVYNLPVVSSSQYQQLSWQKTRTDDFGVMLRQQSTLWRKLLLYASVRFDNVMYNNFTISQPSWSVAWHPDWAQYYDASFQSKNKSGVISHYHSTGWTPGAGFSYRLTPQISAYGNYSSSFKISTQQVSGATTGSYFLPNERAIGYDYGFKASFLDERLTATLGGFYILQKNMSVTAELADGTTIKEAAGTVTSRGFSFTTNYEIDRHWAFNAEYYHDDARWGETGVDYDLSGRTKARIPPDIVTLTPSYKFTGRLSGLRLFGNYQFTGPTPAEDRGNITVGSVTPKGSNNGLRDLRLPSYELVNVGASYEFKTGGALRHKVQLNVNNLLDKTYVTYSRGAGDRRTYLVTYQLDF